MKAADFNWESGVFLIAYHILLLVGLPIYFFYYTPSLSLILISIVLLFLTGLSITGGYHRYFSHRTYRAKPVVELFLLFFGAMAGQGSALRWSYDHRLHHAYVDTDRDPYSIKKGFWYAHFLWMFKKQPPIQEKTVADLVKNKAIRFQDRHFPLLMTITNVMVWLGVGWLLNDYMGAFFIAVWLRLFTLHHSTWFINSLAHTWGEKPFCQEQSAVDNYILSVMTFGEGYHNYHHTFANDYRNGVRWYHYDPTKWFIWTLNKLGLTSDLKRMDWYSIRKRMVIERKSLLMDRIESLWANEKEELSRMVDELSDRLLEQMNSLRALKEKYSELKKECAEKDLLKQIQTELKALQKELRHDWTSWVQLSRNILYLKQLPA